MVFESHSCFLFSCGCGGWVWTGFLSFCCDLDSYGLINRNKSIKWTDDSRLTNRHGSITESQFFYCFEITRLVCSDGRVTTQFVYTALHYTCTYGLVVTPVTYGCFTH